MENNKTETTYNSELVLQQLNSSELSSTFKFKKNPLPQYSNLINETFYKNSMTDTLTVRSPTIQIQYQPCDLDTSITHVVNTLPPMKRISTQNFSKVECSNVTTIWMENFGFTYLTSFGNDHNYFFLPREDDGFSLKDWQESYTFNKISRQQMSQFVDQFNAISKISSIISSYKSKDRYINKRNLFLTLFFFCFFMFSLIIWIKIFGKELDLLFMIILPILWASSFLTCLVFLILLISNFSKSEDSYEMEIDRLIINKTSNIESLISSWNNHYFKDLGMYIMVPKNLKYIQFVLNSKIKFIVEDHSYPADLAPRRYYNISTQL